MRQRIAVLWLAGFAAGLLVLLPRPYWVFVLWAFVAVETAHSLAPIVLAWTKAGIRRDIFASPQWWLGVPALAACFAMAWPIHQYANLGAIRLDFGIAGAFLIANAWHFGMQNFGVARMLGAPGHRYAIMAGCLILTAGGMIVTSAIASRDVAFVVVMVISVNHWVTDIGLTGMTFSKRQAACVVAILLALGCIGYWWFHLTPNGMRRTTEELPLRCMYALNLIHVLFYSRWVWQRGRELLSAAHGTEWVGIFRTAA
jgi:hypothetical protein